jgi:hypothetical protein
MIMKRSFIRVPTHAHPSLIQLLVLMYYRYTKCNNCHGGISPSAGIKLDTYTEAVKYVNDKSLMGSINHASGYSAMPKGGYKMPACEIQKIQDWINSGSPNN